jgi:hypothetical protein
MVARRWPGGTQACVGVRATLLSSDAAGPGRLRGGTQWARPQPRARSAGATPEGAGYRHPPLGGSTTTSVNTHGLRAVAAGPLEANTKASSGVGEDDQLGIGLGVVGQHPLDPHPVVGEEASRLDQEAGRGHRALIGQDLAEGDPGTFVHGRMNVVMADASAPLVFPRFGGVVLLDSVPLN